MRILLRLVGFLKLHRLHVALAVFLGVATVVGNVGLLATAAYVISAAALMPILAALAGPIYLVRLFGVGRAATRYAERMVSHSLTFKLLADLRTWFYASLEPLAPARVLRYRTGDLLSRIVKDVEELENIYLRVLSPVIVATLVSLLTFLLFYLFGTLLAFVSLGFLVITGVGVPLLVRGLERGLGRRQLELRGELNARILDDVGGVQDLLAFGLEHEQQREVSALNRKLARIQRRMAFITGLQNALGDLMMNLAMLAVLGLAIPLVARGEIPGVYLAFLALVILGSFEAVQHLGVAFQFLGRSVEAGRRLFEVVDAEPEVTDPPKPFPPPEAHTLEFDRVSFRYEEDGPPVLEDVTFSLVPGHRIAVVGPSGAGKSTLVHLALRFWDPTTGEVRLGGRNVSCYEGEDLRREFAVVSQNTHVFNDTLRGNLLIARSEATDEELERVLGQTQLSGLVRRLPKGLDSPLGEQGLSLSGGERQRLAVGRALLKGASLLVLDEPTANLDPITERGLLDATYEAMRNRATLVVTHRLVRMEEMDEILVLDAGRIVERGTHKELARAGGLYHQMLEAQKEMFVTL
jgi:ATP-binding cassette, subfamily C, bacterial CydC